MSRHSINIRGKRLWVGKLADSDLRMSNKKMIKEFLIKEFSQNDVQWSLKSKEAGLVVLSVKQV